MNKEVAEGLKTALANEIAGENFYTQTAENAKDDFTRNTFEHLAEDELYHIEIIMNFIKTEKAEDIKKRILERNPKSGMKFFGMSKNDFKEHKNKFTGDLAPYKMAIDIEIKSYNLYKELKEKAEDQKAKDFFEFLMKEEKTHRIILEEALDFLQNPEDYFLKIERWSFD